MRFEQVSQDVLDLFGEVRSKYFEDLDDVNFKLVFDSKKRIKNGKYVFAQIKKVDDLTGFLVEDEINYVIMIDKNVWGVIEKEDKIRIVRHELNHVFIDNHTDKNPFKIKCHDFEDFAIEVERNKDDPRWLERLVAVAESIYNQEDEE